MQVSGPNNVFFFPYRKPGFLAGKISFPPGIYNGECSGTVGNTKGRTMDQYGEQVTPGNTWEHSGEHSGALGRTMGITTDQYGAQPFVWGFAGKNWKNEEIVKNQI